MRTQSACLKAILAAVVVAACLNAAAPTKQEIATRGLGGTLTGFVVVDNCRAFSIVVGAAQTASRPGPGAPVDSSYASINIEVSDQCALKVTRINVAGEPGVSGTVQRGVQIAGTVSGSQFDFTTFTSSPISGAVNMTLTPTGQPVLTRSESTFGNGFTFQRMRSVGFAADAIASGSIVFDGFDYLAAALASGSTLYTTITSSDEGSMTIVK